jgi:hypothetical protein
MVAMWQRYGPALRLAGIACAVAYACASGVTVLMEFADYHRPYAQLALWVGCALGYVVVAWRTRAPSRAPALLLALLAANAASAVDPGVGRDATAWVPNLVGAVLTLVAFTGPIHRTALLLGAAMTTNGLLIAFRYVETGAGAAVVGRLATGNAGMLTGVLPALIIMLALRHHAVREADQRRRTRTVESARAAELAVRTDRRTLLEPALRDARQVLDPLAAGSTDPTHPAVRAAARAAERRLRAALQVAVDESALATLATQLTAAGRGGVELVTQGGPGWDALPAAVRDDLTELLHRVAGAPQARRVNLTVIPDGGRIWISLTVDGAPPVAGNLPPALDRPRSRGRAGDQWWLEWIVPEAAPAPADGLENSRGGWRGGR